MPDLRYWDADVFLSYINHVDDRMPTLDALLAESESGAFEIITSTFSIVEVAFALAEKEHKALSPEQEAAIDDLWRDRGTIKLVEFYEDLARDARSLIRIGLEKGWHLKPKDAVHLASAAANKVTVMHTYDDRLKKYGAVLGFEVKPPFTPKPRLLE